MDDESAARGLRKERAEVEQLLTEALATGRQDRDAEAEADEAGDSVDAAQPLTEEGVNGAVVASLRDRLAAIERAERRLAEGTYGLSVRSGLPIPDARLEVEPAAELTVEEAQASS
ncbi:MAG: TraR/DksA family transcriptional regulator [Nocardioidaceae bacterium]